MKGESRPSCENSLRQAQVVSFDGNVNAHPIRNDDGHNDTAAHKKLEKFGICHTRVSNSYTGYIEEAHI